MKKYNFNYQSSYNNVIINAVKWIPETTPKGIIQIAHGVTEYIERYESFANYMTNLGYIVVGNDALGHGRSLIGEKKMYTGGINSWKYLVEDIKTCHELIKKEYPDIPYYILGFSLGSFLVRTYLSDYNPKVSKVFLLGTGYQSPLLISLIKPVVKSEIKKHGDDKPSKTINDLSFGTYNKKINNPTTPYDWLSKSKENLDNYQKDPLVGKELTTSLFYEMLNGISYTSKISTIEKMDKSIPIILLSGEEDPVGDMTKGITKYYNVLKKHGYNVELKLYPNTRHDLLNEESKEKIYKDISQYIEKESIN